MANVELDLEDIATGTHRAASSNSEGFFTIDLTTAGHLPSYCKSTGVQFGRDEIPLQVNQTGNITVTMKPGDVSQQVTISGTSVALESETSSLGGVVQGNQVPNCRFCCAIPRN